jgi:hypothetical protein
VAAQEALKSVARIPRNRALEKPKRDRVIRDRAV